MRNANLSTVPKATYHAYPPRKLPWPINDILDAVRADYQTFQADPATPVPILLGANITGFNIHTLKYFAELRRIKTDGAESFAVKRYINRDSLLDELYVVTKSNCRGIKVSVIDVQAFQNDFETILEAIPARFEVMQHFTLLDGQATLYRRTQPALRDLANLNFLKASPSIPLEETLDLYERVARFSPSNRWLPRAYFALGKLYQEQENSETAIRIYQEGISALPANGQLHARLAETYWQMGQVDSAIVEYQAALHKLQYAAEANPDSVDPWRELGQALFVSGQYDKKQYPAAIAAYERAVALAPDRPELHVELANAYRANGQFDKAIVELETAISLAPDNPWPRRVLADTYRSLGQVDQAIDVYQQALTIAPDDFGTHWGLALAYEAQGLTGLAIQEFQKVIELAPEHELAHRAKQRINRLKD